MRQLPSAYDHSSIVHTKGLPRSYAFSNRLLCLLSPLAGEPVLRNGRGTRMSSLLISAQRGSETMPSVGRDRYAIK